MAGQSVSNDNATECSDFEKPAVELKVTRGPCEGRTFRFTDHQTCVVGRSKQAHLRLSPDRRFSRFHCRLEINPPEICVIDLGSTNGTKVNGLRIETALLNSGDEVAVGDTQFHVQVYQPPKAVDQLSMTTLFPENAIHDVGPIDFFDDVVPSLTGYSIERQLGHGTMGAVYLARRATTGDKVAIKIIRPAAATDAKIVERFRREASIILRLRHKRIVRSLDFRITEDQVPFLIMEYIDVVDLRRILWETNLNDRVRMAAGIMARVLEALEYAHSREIVHRDLKPSNFLAYRSRGKLQVKLSDFGLAKNYIDAGFSHCSTSNEICGTIAFMPPEQIIDCRYAKPSCDIYAAGVCLYNLITGRLPFESPNAAQQISSILNASPVSVAAREPGVPDGIVRVIDRAIARRAADRFDTAEQMRQALLPFTFRQ
ncbi:MAG: protein kinase [Planctomycetaceae bacterium]